MSGAGLRAALKVRGAIRGPLLSLAGALVLIVAGATYYNIIKTRTVVLSGATELIEVRFDAPRTWRLPETSVCTLDRPARGVAPPPDGRDGPCGASEVEQGPFVALDVVWPRGAAVQIERIGEGALVVTIIAAPDRLAGDGDGERIALAEGARIVSSGWGDSGGRALPVSGDATLGAPVRAGADALLIDAAYEFREALLWRETTVGVLDGRLLAGDVARITERDGPAFVEGFVAPEAPNRFGMRFVVVGGAHDAQIVVVRTGAAPFVISSRWSDRALKDPLALALTAIGGVLLVVVTLVTEITALARGSGPRDAPNDVASADLPDNPGARAEQGPSQEGSDEPGHDIEHVTATRGT